MLRIRTLISRAHEARVRLRGSLRAVLQTAAAAVAAWYLAVLLLPDPRPSFASIAAVIAVGAAHGRRAGRAAQLIGGVVLGVAVASLIVHVIGAGAPQLGVLVVLAMSAAILLGGGELLVVEAAVSAILLVALDPGTSDGFSPSRILEAVIGGASALAVSSVLFPPDPALGPARAMQTVLAELGRALEEVALGLDRRDHAAAERALVGARGIDDAIRAVEDALAAGRDTARYAPPRRSARVELDRYARSVRQIDLAVRNARVLARHALRAVREGGEVPSALAAAVRDLAAAVWELAAAYDAPRHAGGARELALRAAAALDGAGDPLAAQVRSLAVDLVRASELVAGTREPADERPTEELLAAAPA